MQINYSALSPEEIGYLKALVSKRGLRDPDGPRFDKKKEENRELYFVFQELVSFYLWRCLEIK